MKFILSIFLIVVTSAFGQKIRLDIAGGYSAGFTSMSGSSVTENYTASSSTYTEEAEYQRIALGNGWLGKFGVSYLFNDQLFLNLSALYANSGEIAIKGNEETNNYFGGFQEHYISEQTLNLQSAYIQLGLGLRRSLGDKMALEMSAGPSMRAFGLLTQKLHSSYTYTTPIPNGSITDEYEQVVEYTPSIEIGGYGDIALNYKLGNRLELFANSTLRLSTYSDAFSKITSIKENGVEQINTNNYTTSQLETEYETHINISTPNPQNEPSKTIKTWTSQSSIQFLLGARYGLGSAPKEAAASTGRKGIYLSLHGGYGIPMAGGTTMNANWMDYSTKQISYGQGVNFGLMVGYGLTNGIALEIGGLYSQSKITYFSGYSTSYNNYTDEAMMARVTAGVKLEGDAKIVNPFIRGGLSLGVFNKLTSTEVYSSGWGNSENEYVLSEKLSVGGYAGIGVSFRVASFLSIEAEGLFNVQNWSPGKAEHTRSVYNGIDQLQGATTSEIETEFVESVTYSSNDPEPNTSEPSKGIKFSLPYSSTMFRIGVRIDLRK